MLASASHDCMVRLWDAKSGQCLQVIQGHRGWMKRLAFTANRKLLVTEFTDFLIAQLWDANTIQCLHTHKGHTGCVGIIIFSQDGMDISGSWSNTVRIWNLGKQLNRPESVKSSPQESGLCPDSLHRLFHTSTCNGAANTMVRAHKHGVHCREILVEGSG